MTLDDLIYVRILSEFCGISQIWKATTAKRMKIDQYCQRQRRNPFICSRETRQFTAT